ncbi:unnamed protein product [Moneuplotes crassus]|uniref:PB1 domain-containing protein n=1 Tax=Euplotes crassus TaxID=5936 RepID=A0AAD2D9L6_EUPCR|nr:unnamed protein product [Moneuplotes crassus]
MAIARQDYEGNYRRFFQPTVNCDFQSLALKMSYRKKTKVAQSLPLSMCQLHKQIQLSFGGIFKETIDLRDFEVYFKDGDGEKSFLINDEDLKAAYRWAQSFSTGMVKVWIEYKYGLSDEQKIEKWHETQSRQTRNPGSGRTKKWDFNAFEDENRVIVRDGYVYRNPRKIKGGKLLYFCEDYERLGCLGRWIVYPMVSGGDFGEHKREHNIPSEMHQCNIPEVNPMNLPNSENILHGGVRKWTRVYEAALIMKNPSMIGSEIISEIKSCVSHADLPPKREIHYIIHKIRRALTPGVAGYGLIDIAKIKTMRGTAFGREISLSMVDQLPRLFLYLYSDWQEERAKEFAKQETQHIYIDLVTKSCPKMWKIIMSISVFEKDTGQLVPLAHSVLQTKRQEGFEIAMKWIRDQLKLKPNIFTIDFDDELLKATTGVYGNSLALVPNFYLLMKRLWIIAVKNDLNKPEIYSHCKKMIYRLLTLCFIARDNISKVYEEIKSQFSQKDPGFVSFFQWYEAMFMEQGLFPPRIWSFSHRTDQIEDFIMCNNGMETYQHYIQTQMKSEGLNFAAYTELMARIETLRKNDYETCQTNVIYGENSQDLNSQKSQAPKESFKGSRLWPSSRIMKFMHENRGTLEADPEHQYVEVDAITEEFVKENNEEFLGSLGRLQRNDEDSVRDILAQENLHMNLEELINLKKEEKQQLKKERAGKFGGYDPRMKREIKAEKKTEENKNNILPEKIKPATMMYEKESSQSSCGPSQFMEELDITRNRVDIAERIMMYAEDDQEKNPFDAKSTQGVISSQGSNKSGLNDLLNVIEADEKKANYRL